MTPKEDQQPMTTREELVGLPAWEDRDVQIVYSKLCDHDLNKPPNPEEHWEGWISRNIVAALRLASRQEVSVEELGLALRLVALDELPPAYFKRGSDVRKAIARDMARALLAKYSMMRRTTEG